MAGGRSKLLAALTGSALRRESDFNLSIVVFVVCTHLWRNRVKRALSIFSRPRFFLLCYFSHHPSASRLTTLVFNLVATALGFIVLGGVGFNGYLLVRM